MQGYAVPTQKVPPARPRIFALIEDAQKRGVTALRCCDCGHVHTNLHMLDRVCNFAHPDADNHDGEICGGTLVEVVAQ